MTLLSKAIGSELAAKVNNFMLFHALVVDRVKMTHSVMLRFLFFYIDTHLFTLVNLIEHFQKEIGHWSWPCYPRIM